MSKTRKFLAAAMVIGASSAQAGGISDNGVNGYWGSDSNGQGDVIGGSVYDILGASITRVGSVLTVVIQTNFAGHAGADPWAAPKGIGYGDVFLAQTWKPYGTDSHHVSDKASNGTKWNWGFSLDNRWNNDGGTFKLYELKGTSNQQAILNSESFMTCTNCSYRKGQATAVKTTSSYAKDMGRTGQWTVVDNKELRFTIDVASTNLMNFSSFAMHWGETCQNDVIEGAAMAISAPGTLPLLALGAGALLWARRRQQKGTVIPAR